MEAHKVPPRFTSCTCPKSSSAYTHSRKLLSKEVQDASSRRSCLRAETRCQGVWSVKTFKRCAGHCLISFLLFTSRLLLQRVIFCSFNCPFRTRTAPHASYVSSFAPHKPYQRIRMHSGRCTCLRTLACLVAVLGFLPTFIVPLAAL